MWRKMGPKKKNKKRAKQSSRAEQIWNVSWAIITTKDIPMNKRLQQMQREEYFYSVQYERCKLLNSNALERFKTLHKSSCVETVEGTALPGVVTFTTAVKAICVCDCLCGLGLLRACRVSSLSEGTNTRSNVHHRQKRTARKSTCVSLKHFIPIFKSDRYEGVD